jgi:Tol biopolymer transport system component
MGSESNVALLGTHVLSVSSGALVARPYDFGASRATAEPIRFADHVGYVGQSGAGAFSVGGGVLAYRSASPDSHLIWFDRNGKEVGSFRAPGDYHHPWLSPDETRVAVERTDPATGNHTIWILDVARGTVSRLLFDAAGAHTPVWSPDGRRIAFLSNRLGGRDLYSIAADGVGSDEKVPRPAEWDLAEPLNDWSQDGRFLLLGTGRQIDVAILPLAAGEQPRVFFESPSTERQGQFSPDVRWLAYTSDESGAQEVYVRPFPAADRKWRISTNGGAQAKWRRDGRELFYLEPSGKLMAVSVKTGPSTFEAGTPTELFDTHITGSFIDRRNQYAVTKDGQRFLLNISAEDERPAPITVVMNGASLLNTKK